MSNDRVYFLVDNLLDFRPLAVQHRQNIAHVCKALPVSGKRHAKSLLFGVPFDQPGSNSEAF